jgi:hypothetical protein
VPRQAKISNIYDLVERAAARREIPRLELWQAATKALLAKNLPALNLSERMNPQIAVTTYRDWLVGYLSSLERLNDPTSGCAHILKRIIVHVRDFKKWLGGVGDGRRGPQEGTTGYKNSDRKLFRRMKKLIDSGATRSAYGAALELAGQIAGSNTSAQSKAKRVSALYRKEYAERR